MAVVVMAFAQRAGAQVSAGEYQVKAAFLHNFARYVEWPAGSFRTAGSPLIIGVVGEDPSGGALDDTLRGRVANRHPVQVRHLRWSDPLDGCHMIFVSSRELDHLAVILKSAGEGNVLTIADIEGFSRSGGAIEFRMVGNRVRFDINLSAAERAGLKISSKLLNVARAVVISSSTRQTQ